MQKIHRDKLLESLDKLNEQLGFVGCRGEMCMTDNMLVKLIQRLEKEMEKKNEKI